MASEVEIAWAAGLFEGEGSIQFSRRRDLSKKGEMRLSLSTTDQDVIEKFAAVIGYGRTYKEAVTKPLADGTRRIYKDAYRWRVARQAEVPLVMAVLLPYLGERRRARWAEVLQLSEEAQPALRVCPQCENEFRPHYRDQVTCSHGCSYRYSKRVGKYTNRRSNRPQMATPKGLT